MFSPIRTSALLLAFTCLAPNAFADSIAKPASHAPIGVMGDHIHKEGEWMISYRYSQMEMDGNRDGTDSLSIAQVHSQFMVAPISMTMRMHMFGVMYGASDDLTLTAMAPYSDKSMQHVVRGSNVHFRTQTEGVGDIKLGGIYNLHKTGDEDSNQQWLLNFGASLPTGSITERGNTPMANNQKLPYAMQLGSGTFDPLLGLTFVNHEQDWSWGSQAGTTLRFGKNSQGYRLGNEYTATAWVARDVSDNASVSLRAEGKSWGNIHGHDVQLNQNMVPTARTDMRGGQRIDVLAGVNLYQPEGDLAGHRLAAEFGLPVFQNLEGPQLETDYRFTLGWQFAF